LIYFQSTTCPIGESQEKKLDLLILGQEKVIAAQSTIV